jgi:hypothetical protein
MTGKYWVFSWALRSVVIAGVIACCSLVAVAADSITGIVRDQTHGQPAVGDDVMLLDPGNGAQQEARAKTDDQGAFSLELHQPGKQYVVRVVHQGINYDQRAGADSAIMINVYDAATQVRGISGGLEIIRAGTNGNQLHVSEMIEIRNNSSPPVTRSGERTFEVYLPANAKIDSVLAAGPENIGSAISATPLDGGAGHYAVNFPLRPGATKFAFNYDLPYAGHAVFHTRSIYPLQQLAVMLPPSMTFKSPSSVFQILPVGTDRYRVEATEQVKAGEGPQFEISGVGALPSMQTQVHASMQSQAVTAQAAPGIVLAPVAQNHSAQQVRSAGALTLTPDAERSAAPVWLRWWPVSICAAVPLAIAGLLLWRRQHALFEARRPSPPMAGESARKPVPLVEALKEGLFQLETDRLQGAITVEAYASTRQALNDTIRWALARARSPRGE